MKMIGSAGIKKESFATDNQIVVNSAPHFAVGVVVSQSVGVEDSATKRKIAKKGTPLTGDLDARTTAFTKATSDNVVGVLQHDVDVTVADANADLLIIGVVNVNRMDSDVQELFTEDMKKALPTVKAIKF
jgi:hypothetical protein